MTLLKQGSETAPSVALISLEPWDAVWRRNQRLSDALVAQGHVLSLLFIEPPTIRRPESRRSVSDRIEVYRPRLALPKRLGGLRSVGRLLRRGVLRDRDVLWINDPTLGVHCLRAGQAALYDVTDD